MMKFKNSKKICLLAAFAVSLSALASGCSSGDPQNADGSESISINVIQEGTTAGGEVSTKMVTVTGEDGEAVTGINGDPLTAPSVTEEVPPDQTVNEEDILAAMTATATAPQINIEKTNSTGRYAYNTLTDREKEIYDAIVKGVEDLRFKICSEDACTLEEWTKIYCLVYNQEPHLFYMASKIKVGKLFYTTKDADEINRMKQAIDAAADKLVQEAAGKSTTFEKLKVFHDYLAYNSTFEKTDGSNDYNTTIYNAFGSGKPQGDIQCAGYAKAVQYLCDKAGIGCMVISGETAEGASHAWNVVDVDGVWYNLDVTWDDPILTTPNYKNIRYNYFLVPDKWIHNITHMHVNEKRSADGSYIKFFDPPACTETAQNYFIKNGLVCGDKDSADKAIRAEIKRAAEDGSRTAHIMVGSKDVYDAIYGDKKAYNSYAAEFSGVKGVSDMCDENMLLIEFDVIYE